MLRNPISRMTGLLTLCVLLSVPTLVRAQSTTSQLFPSLSPRDWIPPAIYLIGIIVVVGVGLRQFRKAFTQQDRSVEKDNYQKQFTEILDRLVAPDPTVRANAALRLAEFGKRMVPVEGTNEQTYPYFVPSTAQLSTALHLETNPGIRSCVRESLQMLTDFAHSIQNEGFIRTLLVETADANRTARSAFIKAFAEYCATLVPGSPEEKTALKRLTTVAQLTDSPEVTAGILTALMTLPEFSRDREIHAAVRATLATEALKVSDVTRFTQLEAAAAALRETRDALAYTLRFVAPAASAPKELEEDPKIAERRPNDMAQPTVARANLCGCFLAGAKLNRTHLRYVDFRDACLQGADLTAADLQGALLMNAQMQEASLNYALLLWANLDNACLDRANLSNAKVKNANLNDASLREADLIGVIFQDTSLVGANFAGACLIESNFEGACLFRNNFEEANLIRANLRKAYLHEADLRLAYLTESQLQEAVLVSANLTGANLMQARLEGAYLKGAQLENAQIFGAVLQGFVNEEKVSADFEKAALNNLNLRNPLTGQVDTQIRDWLIRYYPREARCLAIDDVPSITGSPVRTTLELPEPEVAQIREALKALEAFKTPESKPAVQPIAGAEPVKPAPAIIPEQHRVFAGKATTIEPQTGVEPVRTPEPVQVPRGVPNSEKVENSARSLVVEITPKPVKEMELMPEPALEELNDTVPIPPAKPSGETRRAERENVPVEIGEQAPLPKGWRYSTRVVVVTPKPESAAPVEEGT